MPRDAKKAGDTELQKLATEFALGKDQIADLIVLDSKSTLCRAGDDNAAGDWQIVQEWLLALRQWGRSVLLVHHAGKNGRSRGTSLIEVALDTIVALRRPAEYEPTAGLVAEIHFEKARAIFGPDVEPFEAAYSLLNGAATWATRGLQDVEMQRVVSLLNEGLTQRDVAQELGMSVGKVNRLSKEAASVGLTRRANGACSPVHAPGR